MSEEDFEVPVLYKGKIVNLTARLISGRYAYKIQFDISDMKVDFEKDDEGSWRAMLTENDFQKDHKIDTGMLQAIAESIDDIMK
ncbi:MAG: hypothetical protein H7329_20725 [Opitutaceae bacterium]|nr:hypothetical protein [Cytophagales bacterium]